MQMCHHSADFLNNTLRPFPDNCLRHLAQSAACWRDAFLSIRNLVPTNPAFSDVPIGDSNPHLQPWKEVRMQVRDIMVQDVKSCHS
jgi:hypothetical protein